MQAMLFILKYPPPTLAKARLIALNQARTSEGMPLKLKEQLKLAV